MPVPFEGPPDELAGLRMFLDEQRAALLRKLDGLDDEQAAHRPTVSDFCMLTLVKHVAFVEPLDLIVDRAGLSGDRPIRERCQVEHVEPPRRGGRVDALLEGDQRVVGGQRRALDDQRQSCFFDR